MHFPLESSISPVTYGRLTGNTLRIDGNAGQIPPAFQFAVLQKTVAAVDVPAVETTDADGIVTVQTEATTREDVTYALCYQGVSQMTQEQWDDWSDQEDPAYILASVAANESLALA